MFNSTSAVVRLHDAFGLSNEKIREVLTAVARATLTLDDAFQLAPAGLERSTGLAAPLVAALINAAPDSAYKKAAALQQRGFAAMTLLDPEYPLQLKGYRDCPPILYVRGEPITIEPRRKWMGDTVFSESTKMGHVNEQGLALAYYGGEGWGKLVRDGKYHDGAFSDELVEAAAALIEREWGELLRQRPWLTFVPSLRHPRLVPDYAARLAKRLNLPCIEAVRCAQTVPEQKTMQNSYQQLANIQQAFALLPFAERGPVILVDDMLDSGWTMTVIGWLLREHGASAVYPFALAKATPSD